MAFALLALLCAGCISSNPTLTADCSRIIDRNEKGDCAYNKSMLMADAILCKNIPDSDRAKKCVNDVAVKVVAEYPCYQHAKLPDREECERQVAKARRDARSNT